MALVITPSQLHQRADFYFQLQALLTAGVPMIQALEMIQKNPPSRKYRPYLNKVIFALQSGEILSSALRFAHGWLPEFDLALLAAGEQSGRLDSTLKLLGNYYKEKAVLTRRIISELGYPFFILHFAVLVFPTSYLTNIFVAGGVEAFVRQKFAVLIPIYVLICLVVWAAQGTHAEWWRALLEKALGSIPVVRTAVKHLILGRFTAALGALLGAGVEVISAWNMAADASGSPAMKTAISKIIPRIQAGETPAEAIQRLRIFPDMFKSLYASGELSGQIDSTLDRLHRFYQEDASTRLQNLSQWIPRILFFIIAVIIGIQIVLFYVGYFGRLGEMQF